MSLTILLAVMTADYISGIIVALMGKSDKSENGGLNSFIGWRGILKKGMMLLVVLVAATLDRVAGDEASMFRDMVCWFYIANECLSILENATRAGIPWPETIRNVLLNLRKKNNGDHKDEGEGE